MEGWVKIASYMQPMEAGFAESLLQSAGIPYFVRGEALSLAFPQPVTLWVPEEHATEAQSLLSAPPIPEDLALDDDE